MVIVIFAKNFKQFKNYSIFMSRNVDKTGWEYVN